MNNFTIYGIIMGVFLLFFAVLVSYGTTNDIETAYLSDNMSNNMSSNMSNTKQVNVSDENNEVSEVVYDSYYGYGDNRYTIENDKVYDKNGDVVCTILNETNSGRYVSINGSVYYESGGAGVYVGTNDNYELLE